MFQALVRGSFTWPPILGIQERNPSEFNIIILKLNEKNTCLINVKAEYEVMIHKIEFNGVSCVN